jgi:hypothetical protein
MNHREGEEAKSEGESMALSLVIPATVLIRGQTETHSNGAIPPEDGGPRNKCVAVKRDPRS